MKSIRLFLVALMLGGAFASAPALAAGNDLPDLSVSKANIAKEALKKDAVCTKCHDDASNNDYVFTHSFAK